MKTPSTTAERTETGIYHVHIDGTKMTGEFGNDVTNNLGFVYTNFSGHPPGYRHFEPNQHFTRKVQTRQEFDAAWKALEGAAEQADFIGYIEGEFIKSDRFIPARPYHDEPVPFRIVRRRLTEGEGFRETELHLVMDKDSSDPRLIERLLEAGLYGAYIPKEDHTALVCTAQGFVRDIDPLTKRIFEYISKAGGATRCTLKEERAIKYRLFGVSEGDLPEIVGSIEWV